MADMDFLKKFIPYNEFMAIEYSLRNAEESQFFKIKMEEIENEIRSMPTYEDCHNKKADEIKVGMHYFGGSTDFWIYALDQDSLEAEAFVCLNGDVANSETGPVFISEIIANRFIELDLFWDTDTRLADIIKNTRRM